MLKKVRIENSGSTDFLPGQMVDKVVLERENKRVKKAKGEQATFEPLILGITKASLATESFLSAASFQETTKVPPRAFARELARTGAAVAAPVGLFHLPAVAGMPVPPVSTPP